MKLIKTTFTLLLFAIFFSCAVKKDLKEQRKVWNYSSWEQQYKDRTLCLCVLQGFSKDVQDSMYKQDKSFYNPLAIGVFDDSINEFLKKNRRKLINDSIKSMAKVVPYDIADNIKGKRVMPYCIELYRSKALRNLAKQQKHYWRNIKDVTEEILKKVPTF